MFHLYYYKIAVLLQCDKTATKYYPHLMWPVSEYHKFGTEIIFMRLLPGFVLVHEELELWTFSVEARTGSEVRKSMDRDLASFLGRDILNADKS